MVNNPKYFLFQFLTDASENPASSMEEDESSPFACRWCSWEVNPHWHLVKMQIPYEEL